MYSREEETTLGVVRISVRLTEFVVGPVVPTPDVQWVLTRDALADHEEYPQRQPGLVWPVWPKSVGPCRYSQPGQNAEYASWIIGISKKGQNKCNSSEVLELTIYTSSFSLFRSTCWRHFFKTNNRQPLVTGWKGTFTTKISHSRIHGEKKTQQTYHVPQFWLK